MITKSIIVTPNSNYTKESGEDKKKVMVESPFAGDTQNNILYLKLCLLDSIDKGEVPYAFHLLYTQALDDSIPYERKLGIDRSFIWHGDAEKKVYCIDRGFSQGMQLGIIDAISNDIEVEFRSVTGHEYIVFWVNKLNNTSDIKKDTDGFREFFLKLDNLESGFSSEYLDKLNKQKELDSSLRELRGDDLVLYEQACLRESLLTEKRAPLSNFLLERQLGVEGGSLVEWEKGAEFIEIYLDAGITKDMISIAKEGIRNGLEIKLATVSGCEDKRRLFEEINRESTCIEKLNIAISIASKDIDAKLSAGEGRKRLIKKLNSASYKSKEVNYSEFLHLSHK